MNAELGKEGLAVGRRIVVIGSTGSGKTTLASQLAARLNIPHVELDALHWEENWIEAPTSVFRERVDLALRGEGWVVDGNYSKARDIIWGRADTLIWLDYHFLVNFRRLTRRTLSRLVTREKIWGKNQESFRQTFLSKDSIIVWLFQTHAVNRKKYPPLLQQPEHAHLKILHFTSPRQTHHWLKTVSPIPAEVLK